MCRGNAFCLFFLFFSPPTIVYGKASVKKDSWFQKKVIKVKVCKKVARRCFQSAAAVRECRIVHVHVRGPGSQLSSLKWECGNRMRRSTQQSGWIPQLNLPIVKLFPHSEFRGVRPNCSSFEKIVTIFRDSFKVGNSSAGEFVS